MQVGASPLCGILHRHIFLCAGIASQFLYRVQKNVVYLFTLYAIFADLLYWNNKELRDSFCPTFIRLTAPSLARGFVQKMGKEETKEEE